MSENKRQKAAAPDNFGAAAFCNLEIRNPSSALNVAAKDMTSAVSASKHQTATRPRRLRFGKEEQGSGRMVFSIPREIESAVAKRTISHVQKNKPKAFRFGFERSRDIMSER